MSSKFAQILIKDSIKEIRKQKLNKNLKKCICKKEKKSNWKTEKKIRLNFKNSWIK